MNTQYVFCKKEDWDKINIPNFEYEIWYYENHVKIETFADFPEQELPFYTFIGTVGDDVVKIEMSDGLNYAHLVMSARTKNMSNVVIAKFFSMNKKYLNVLSWCDERIPTCMLAYKTNRDFEEEKAFDELMSKNKIGLDDEW